MQKKYGLKTVTPRSIAYTATQVAFALSDYESWPPKIGTLVLKDLYDTIVVILSRPGDPFARRVLRAWNECVAL